MDKNASRDGGEKAQQCEADASSPGAPCFRHGRFGDQNGGDAAQCREPHNSDIEQPSVSPLNVHAERHDRRDKAEVEHP